MSNSFSKERFKAIGSVYVLLVNQQGQILLLRRCNTGFCDGEYGLPSGHLEARESVRQGMMREIQEEIGIEVDADELRFAHMRSRNAEDGHRIDYFFEAYAWEGEVKNCEPNKCDELIWVSPDDLPANTIAYIREVISFWQEGVLYSEQGWSKKKINQARAA